ncbi:MAG: hypothetical protein EHM41_08850 [Chloroflexi bacterium]|nr:MAG: hypothetical protein EHM41_08850 [Chloroflexota bacterium]
MKLDEITPQKYNIALHPKFRANCSIPEFLSSLETVSIFLQAVPFCLMEIKYALNSDISEVHDQLSRYYDAVAKNPTALAEETEVILKQ